ncbi:MAG: SRPBCC family protein, partial [Chloroflexi bacterium]|nr:SRPBCC family protein [Chloroflexota bacterium]
MATKLNFEVTINRPVEKVFAFATDPANSAKWQSGIIESKMTTPGPMGVGSMITDVRTFVGQRLESTIEVTEFELNKKRTFKSAGGPIKFMATETYEAVGGGTKVAVAV